MLASVQEFSEPALADGFLAEIFRLVPDSPRQWLGLQHEGMGGKICGSKEQRKCVLARANNDGKQEISKGKEEKNQSWGRTEDIASKLQSMPHSFLIEPQMPLIPLHSLPASAFALVSFLGSSIETECPWRSKPRSISDNHPVSSSILN